MTLWKPRGQVALAAGIAVLAATFAPTITQATAATRVPAVSQRIFLVDVSGVQATSWTLRDPSQNACDPALTGSGSERVSFRSVKPERLLVRRYGTSYVIVGDPYKVLETIC